MPRFEFVVPTAMMTGRHFPSMHTWFSTNLDFCTSLLVGHQLKLLQLWNTSPFLFINVCFGSVNFQSESQLKQACKFYSVWLNFGLSLYLDYFSSRTCCDFYWAETSKFWISESRIIHFLI